MHLNFVDLKINIFPDNRVFVLRTIPKTENSKIMEFMKNPKILKYKNVTPKAL